LPVVTLEVRDVRPEELAEAGAVTVAAYAEFVRPGDADWEAYVDELRDVEARAARAVVLVAVEEPGGVLGTVTLELSTRIDDDFEPLEPYRAHVRMLAVRPDVRRRGVARSLMETCADRARAAGKRRLTLHTTERMVSAQAMYERLGFARSEDHVFPSGLVLLGYELAL
jgi:ribosomal protein S18 acetylase RimI-like enzyme